MSATLKTALTLITVLFSASCINASDDGAVPSEDVEWIGVATQPLCEYGRGYYCVGNVLTWQEKANNGECKVNAEQVCVLGCVDAGPGRHDYCAQYAGD